MNSTSEPIDHMASKWNALSNSLALIEFKNDGTIVDANDNFLSSMGYTLKEVKGKHHRIFVDPNKVSQPEYKHFWASLNRGEYQNGDIKRIKKNGDPIFLNASYTPILDSGNKVTGVIKCAQDITEKQLIHADHVGQIDAIHKSQAIIEFDLMGKILAANENFLATLGYTSDEVVGNHHRIFCDTTYSNSTSYQDFWTKLASGDFQSGEFKRLHKDGSEVWIQASYNPIFNMEGIPFKVVKFATDITERKLREIEEEELNRHLGRIDLTIDGHVITATDKFLSYFGYTLQELKGQHHRALCPPELTTSPEYSRFWTDLKLGKAFSGEFKRIDKGGKTVWLEARYTPIKDFSGTFYKVVKYATDITQAVEAREKAELISQGVQENSSMVSAASLELNAQATQMKKSIDDVLQEVESATSETDHLKGQMDGVMSATEEMNIAVQEISKGAQEAASISDQAVSTAENANHIISTLGKSSAEISNVIKAISTVAQQTNLLALNATIEAARAGEAGKGFSVVASEVKELAKETRTATDDITKKIETIQSDTAKAISAIEDISNIISRLSQIANTTASSVEEQSVTTSEMTKNISESNANTTLISESMSKVIDQVRTVVEGVNENTEASSSLSQLAENLDRLVKK